MPARLFALLIAAVLVAAALTVALFTQLPPEALALVLPATLIAAWAAHRASR